MSAAGTPPDHAERRVSESLQRLKRHGCSLLVVGSVSAETRAAAVQRLLGAERLRRRRIVAVTDGTADLTESLSQSPETFVLDHATEATTRDGTTGRRASPGASRHRRVAPGLDTLETAIRDEVDRLARLDGPLDAAELRLSVDSLRPLLRRHGVDAVGEFVDDVSTHVRAVDGMAHYVLPEPYDSAVVQSTSDHVDAVVELRARRDGPDQRWHLSDSGLTTPWIDF